MPPADGATSDVGCAGGGDGELGGGGVGPSARTNDDDDSSTAPDVFVATTVNRVCGQVEWFVESQPSDQIVSEFATLYDAPVRPAPERANVVPVRAVLASFVAPRSPVGQSPLRFAADAAQAYTAYSAAPADDHDTVRLFRVWPDVDTVSGPSSVTVAAGDSEENTSFSTTRR